MRNKKVTAEKPLMVQKPYKYPEGIVEEIVKISGRETVKTGVKTSENAVVVELLKKALGQPYDLKTVKA